MFANLFKIKFVLLLFLFAYTQTTNAKPFSYNGPTYDEFQKEMENMPEPLQQKKRLSEDVSLREDQLNPASAKLDKVRYHKNKALYNYREVRNDNEQVAYGPNEDFAESQDEPMQNAWKNEDDTGYENQYYRAGQAEPENEGQFEESNNRIAPRYAPNSGAREHAVPETERYNKLKRNVKINSDIAKINGVNEGPCPPHTAKFDNKIHADPNQVHHWSHDKMAELAAAFNEAQDNFDLGIGNVKSILTEMGVMGSGSMIAKKREVNQKDLNNGSSENENKRDAENNVKPGVVNEDQNEALPKETDEELDTKIIKKRDTHSVTEKTKDVKVSVRVKDSPTTSNVIVKANADGTTKIKRKVEEKVENSAISDIFTAIPNGDGNNKESQLKEQEKRKIEDDEYFKQLLDAKVNTLKEKVKREIIEEQLQNFGERYSDNDNLGPRNRRQAKNEEAFDNLGLLAMYDDNDVKNMRGKRANFDAPKMSRNFQENQDDDVEEISSDFEDSDFAETPQFINKRKLENMEDENDYYYVPTRNRRSNEIDYADENARNTNKYYRKKRDKIFNEQNCDNVNDSDKLENLETDFFGSLPQPSNRELTRYKRIKRDKPIYK